MTQPVTHEIARQRGRVMFLATNLDNTGGAEVQCAGLMSRLMARGWKVTAVSLMPPATGSPAPADAVLAGLGVPYMHLDMRRGVADPRAALRLRDLVRRERPQILHAHMTHASLLARLARPILPIDGLVCTEHSARLYNTEGKGWQSRERAHRWTDWLADRTTAVSKAGGEYFLENQVISRRALRVIYNGVDTTRFTADPIRREEVRTQLGTGNFLWLSVGRLDGVKDYPTLIQAFGIHLQTFPDSVLWIAGDGPYRQLLSDQIAAAQLDASVRLLGHRSDVLALMQAADGFALSSLFEGLALVLIEASCCELPIVATRTGGNPEIVLDGIGGWLAQVGDAADIAAAMDRVRALPPASRLAMGAAQRQHAISQFDFESVVDQWESLYREVLEER